MWLLLCSRDKNFRYVSCFLLVVVKIKTKKTCSITVLHLTFDEDMFLLCRHTFASYVGPFLGIGELVTYVYRKLVCCYCCTTIPSLKASFPAININN